MGRASEPFIREGCTIYEERIRRWADLQVVVVPEERISSRGHKEYILRQEGRRIQEKITADLFTVTLDERGNLLSSDVFARSLETWSCGGLKEIAFILGGPYGLEKNLKEQSDFQLSLSPMTIPHGMAKIFLLEQVYRAFTLLRGEPYHK